MEESPRALGMKRRVSVFILRHRVRSFAQKSGHHCGHILRSADLDGFVQHRVPYLDDQRSEIRSASADGITGMIRCRHVRAESGQGLDGGDQQPLVAVEVKTRDRSVQRQHRLGDVFPERSAQVFSVRSNHRAHALSPLVIIQSHVRTSIGREHVTCTSPSKMAAMS